MVSLLFIVWIYTVIAAERKIYLFIVVMAGTWFQIIYTVWQNGGSGNLWSGSFFNAGLFGGFMALGFIAACTLFIQKIPCNNASHLNKFFTLLVGFSGVIFLFALYKSGSRAALVAAGGGAFFLFITFLLRFPYIKSFLARHKWYLGVLFLFFIFSSAIFLYNIRPASANGRLLIWKSAIEMWKDKPLTGFGFDGFRQNYMFYQAAYLDKHPESSYHMLAGDTAFAFNEPLKVITEQGIFGALVFLFIVWSVFRFKPPWKEYFKIVPCQGLLLVLLLFGLFSYPSESYVFLAISACAFGLLSNDSKAVICLKNSTLIKILTFLFIVGFTGYLFYGYKTFEYRNAAVQFDRMVEHDIPVLQKPEELERLYPLLNTSVEYLDYYGEILNKIGQHEKALAIYFQLEKIFPTSYQQLGKGTALYHLERYPESDNAWIMAGNMVPAKITPHYLLAKSYAQRGMYHKAVFHANRALKSEVKVYTPQIFYMRKELSTLLEN